METIEKIYTIDNLYEKKVREELFDSGELSDVTFWVGTKAQQFKAHHFILRTSSFKFNKMLELHKDFNKPILVPEIEPDVFEQLMRAIYLHRIEIRSFETALACINVFEDFGFPSAVKQCEDYLKHSIDITVNNAIPLYELNIDAGRAEIIEKCLNLFSNQTRDILKSVTFTRARPETVKAIFDLPELNITSELDLLETLRDYAEMHGALPPHVADGDEKRFQDLIKPALAKVRLLTIPPKDIVCTESIRVMYSNDQILGVLANLTAPGNGLFKVPEGVSLSTESRVMEKYKDQRNSTKTSGVGSESIISGSSNGALVETAMIDSQLCETPKSSHAAITNGSIDYTPSKVQKRLQISLTESPGEMPTINSSTYDPEATLPDQEISKKHESIVCTPDINPIQEMPDNSSFRSTNGNVPQIKVWTKTKEVKEFTPQCRQTPTNKVDVSDKCVAPKKIQVVTSPPVVVVPVVTPKADVPPKVVVTPQAVVTPKTVMTPQTVVDSEDEWEK